MRMKTVLAIITKWGGKLIDTQSIMRRLFYMRVFFCIYCIITQYLLKTDKKIREDYNYVVYAKVIDLSLSDDGRYLFCWESSGGINRLRSYEM